MTGGDLTRPRAIELATRPEPLEVTLERSAVLVVDMQNAFAKPGGLLDLAGIDIAGAAAVVRTIRAVLDAALRARDIRYLLFVGIATNVCVESTLRDAYFHEYWPILVTDAAMQAGPPAAHQATIFNVESFFGWTLAAESLVRSLRNAA